jgi:dsDNA-specific endonuclease/ATPase MutS2
VCKNPPLGGRVFYRLISAIINPVHMLPDDANKPLAIPITDELDLHTFLPAEISHLLDDYFAECRLRGLLRVRVIHGKGTGTLRATVHAHLRRSTAVASFATGDENSGGWGATIVILKPDNS